MTILKHFSLIILNVYAYLRTACSKLGYISSENPSGKIYCICMGARYPRMLHVNASVEVMAIIIRMAKYGMTIILS